MAGTALADVSTPVSVGYTTSGNALLGIPRYRGGRQGDTLVIVSAQQGSNQTGWVVSYNRGTTWLDVRARWMAMNNGTTTWYSTDHSAAWFAGGLHIAFRGYSNADPAGYRYVAAPYSGEANMEAVDFPATGTDTYYPIVVASGANDVWLFDMNEGSSRDNLRYWHSTDRFATPVTPGRVCTVTDDPQNYWRIGAIMGANGYPKVSTFKFTGGFCIWTYNPATHSFDSALVVANALGGLARSYAHTEMNGLDHVVYSSGTSAMLVHFFETSDGHFDSVIASTGGTDTYNPQLCVYGEGAAARLYVAYVDRNAAACVKGWTAADGWDADSVVVSGAGHRASDVALVPQVPSSWGFLPIWYRNSSDNNLYFVKMTASPGTSDDTIPPDPIIDLGAATGTENGTINLTWTATGDDGADGTADSYAIRYSLDSITDANWLLATVYPSPPVPQPSGSDEHLTLGGLIPAEVYFVAVRAVDNGANQSELSNVTSAEACLDIGAGVDDPGAGLPDRFELHQNFPNPFNPTTTIEYTLARQSRIQLAVYNLQGQRVALLVDRTQPAGHYNVAWEARNADNSALASGIYFCRLQADEFIETTKMVLLR
jgi:hypothetical protein